MDNRCIISCLGHHHSNRGGPRPGTGPGRLFHVLVHLHLQHTVCLCHVCLGHNLKLSFIYKKQIFSGKCCNIFLSAFFRGRGILLFKCCSVKMFVSYNMCNLYLGGGLSCGVRIYKFKFRFKSYVFRK